MRSSGVCKHALFGQSVVLVTCTAHPIHGLLWDGSALEMLSGGSLSLATSEDLEPSSRSLQGLGKDIS